MRATSLIMSGALAFSLAACESETDPEAVAAGVPTLEDAPATYAFASRYGDGSSVAYSGQTARLVLMGALVNHINGLTARLDGGDLVPASGDVVAELDFFFRFDGETSGDLEHGFATTPAPRQGTFNAISTNKDLVGKLAGNDPVGQHKDWGTEFVGWGAKGSTSPEALVSSWFAAVEALAIARANGELAMGADGQPIAVAYVSADGRDYKQLIDKFLGVALSFSQGVDDYLDDDVEGKGLNSANTQDGDSLYSTLEHQWDEGFGYFGAARNFGAFTDDEIAAAGGREGWATGAYDADGDGAIDLTSEINLGHAVNAAKRDRGAQSGIDLTQKAWDAFRLGRTVIHGAEGPLSSAEMDAVQAARDEAVLAWEQAIMATAIHYINDTLGDMAKFGTDEYVFLDHAKHWSELKGFAFAPQFNPRSPLSDSQFEQLHQLIGDAPVLPGDDAAAAAYADSLRQARALLGEAYGFETGDVEGW